jgi:hypothetical protein
VNDLKFVAISDDGKMIILQTPDGAWIEVPFDSSLVTSDRPEASESVTHEKLSPREIQSRIRAGASPEALAQASGNSLSRIMSFAPPILLERQHVATKAARTIVRRASGAGPLSDVIVARLAPHGVAPSDIAWDSYKREDGRWTVRVSYPSKEGERVGTWLFDVRNSALVPADDEARWLVGEAPARNAVTQTADANVSPTVPHLMAVPTLKSDVEVEPEPEPAEENAEVEVEADSHVDDEPQHVSDEDVDLIAKPTATLFDNQSPAKKSPSPSWDEILFGRAPENN